MGDAPAAASDPKAVIARVLSPNDEDEDEEDEDMDVVQPEPTAAASTQRQMAQPQPATSITEAELDAWLNELKPPPGTWPSVGDWPREQQDVQWLDLGAAMVATRDLPMSREIGEHSSCLSFGRKLGAPAGRDARVDRAWDEVSGRVDALHHLALTNIIEIDMADAPPARRAVAELEVRRLFTVPIGVAKLRRYAREFWREPAPEHPRDTPYCWAWDAWIAHEPYSRVWVVDAAFTLVFEDAELRGLVDPPCNLACIVDGEGCAQHYGMTVRDGEWRSLHPCMHWLCGVCADNWFKAHGNDTCPACRTPVKFYSEF